MYPADRCSIVPKVGNNILGFDFPRGVVDCGILLPRLPVRPSNNNPVWKIDKNIKVDDDDRGENCEPTGILEGFDFE